jgi:two-component system cell cycle sensor histidine kinase/response regulator CckA
MEINADKGKAGHGADLPKRDEGSGARILLVEDDPVFRSTVRLTLKQLGHSVTVADNAKSALEIAAGDTDIQLLITDVIMPGMNGPELARRIKVILPHSKVLFISGYALATITERMGALELTPFLRKPFQRNQIEGCLKSILHVSQG